MVRVHCLRRCVQLFMTHPKKELKLDLDFQEVFCSSCNSPSSFASGNSSTVSALWRFTTSLQVQYSSTVRKGGTKIGMLV